MSTAAGTDPIVAKVTITKYWQSRKVRPSKRAGGT